jgi:hypothetical protein
MNKPSLGEFNLDLPDFGGGEAAAALPPTQQGLGEFNLEPLAIDGTEEEADLPGQPADQAEHLSGGKVFASFALGLFGIRAFRR